MSCVITGSRKITGNINIRGMDVLFSLYQSELLPARELKQSPWYKYSCIRKQNSFPAAFLITCVYSQWLLFSPSPLQMAVFANRSWRLTRSSCWSCLAPSHSPPTNTLRREGHVPYLAGEAEALGSECRGEISFFTLKSWFIIRAHFKFVTCILIGACASEEYNFNKTGWTRTLMTVSILWIPLL